MSAKLKIDLCKYFYSKPIRRQQTLHTYIHRLYSMPLLFYYSMLQTSKITSKLNKIIYHSLSRFIDNSTNIKKILHITLKEYFKSQMKEKILHSYQNLRMMVVRKKSKVQNIYHKFCITSLVV